MGVERFKHLKGNKITLTGGIGNIDDEIIYVSTKGNNQYGGGIVSPYLTITKAFSAVTSSRKTIRVYPGTYTEEATLDWPDIDGVVLEGMGARNDQVTIIGAEDEDVIDIDPTTKTSTFDASIAGLTIDGDGDCTGLRIDNGDVGSGIKFIVFLNDVNISMNEDSYESIEVVHTDNKTEAIRIYHHGPNEFEGVCVFEPEYAGDRFYFNGAKFPSGMNIGNGAVAARFEFRNCVFTHDGGGGDEGNDAQYVTLIGCSSETGGVYHAVDNNEIGTNISSFFTIIGHVDDAMIYVSKGGRNTNNGDKNEPFLTVTAALAAVTSDRKVVKVLPGVYEETTGITWPTVSGVQLIGEGNRWETVISAGAGDQVINIAPGSQSGTFEATIQSIQIDHDESGQDGLVLTHTSVGKKINIYLGQVGMDGSGSDYALKVVHGGSGNAVRIYWDGGNGSIPGKIDLDSEDGGDRFYVENVMFEADIDAGASDTTQTIRLFNCQIAHQGFSGGGANGIVVLGGCRSVTGTTFAKADDTDVTGSSSLTGPTTFP